MYLYKLHVYNSGETITATVLPTSNLTVRLQSITVAGRLQSISCETAVD